MVDKLFFIWYDCQLKVEELRHQDGQEELLAAFCERIERGEGVECRFFHQTRRYLFLDDYKYWIMVECDEVARGKDAGVINRAG